jgi:hypothetical protein
MTKCELPFWLFLLVWILALLTSLITLTYSFTLAEKFFDWWECHEAKMAGINQK